jgi:hypothetical protein
VERVDLVGVRAKTISFPGSPSTSPTAADDQTEFSVGWGQPGFTLPFLLNTNTIIESPCWPGSGCVPHDRPMISGSPSPSTSAIDGPAA